MDDGAVFEFVKPVGDQVRACLWQGVAQVGEALRSKEQFAHDEQRPSLSDDIESAGYPAGVPIGTARWHTGMLSACVVLNN